MIEVTSLIGIVTALGGGAFAYLFNEINNNKQQIKELQTYQTMVENKLFDIGMIIQADITIDVFTKSRIVEIIKRK